MAIGVSVQRLSHKMYKEILIKECGTRLVFCYGLYWIILT
jgi:hypothetical protein